jgi:hypothetical protein
MGPLEASGRLKAGWLLTSINGASQENVPYKAVIEVRP